MDKKKIYIYSNYCQVSGIAYNTYLFSLILLIYYIYVPINVMDGSNILDFFSRYSCILFSDFN